MRDHEAFADCETLHPFEPVFVKNLETVQADERDVMLWSVGYGKDAARRLHNNFGPLNQVADKRRLNVLITRARVRTELFANFSDEDMDPVRCTAFGLCAPRTYLAFARTGVLEAPMLAARGDNSPFQDGRQR